jgi:hypothetical protein
VFSLRLRSTYCVFPLRFPTVQFKDATLPEVISSLRRQMAQGCYDLVGKRPLEWNVLLDEARLTPEQLAARISIDETDITAEELLYALCKGLGVGYRVDAYAVLISSRANVGLPKPPSSRVARVPDGLPRKQLIFIGRPVGNER